MPNPATPSTPIIALALALAAAPPVLALAAYGPAPLESFEVCEQQQLPNPLTWQGMIETPCSWPAPERAAWTACIELHGRPTLEGEAHKCDPASSALSAATSELRSCLDVCAGPGEDHARAGG